MSSRPGHTRAFLPACQRGPASSFDFCGLTQAKRRSLSPFPFRRLLAAGSRAPAPQSWASGGCAPPHCPSGPLSCALSPFRWSARSHRSRRLTPELRAPGHHVSGTRPLPHTDSTGRVPVSAGVPTLSHSLLLIVLQSFVVLRFSIACVRSAAFGHGLGSGPASLPSRYKQVTCAGLSPVGHTERPLPVESE